MKSLDTLIAESRAIAADRLGKGQHLPDVLPNVTAAALSDAIQSTCQSLDLSAETAESVLIAALADIWNGEA